MGGYGQDMERIYRDDIGEPFGRMLGSLLGGIGTGGVHLYKVAPAPDPGACIFVASLCIFDLLQNASPVQCIFMAGGQTILLHRG